MGYEQLHQPRCHTTAPLQETIRSFCSVSEGSPTNGDDESQEETRVKSYCYLQWPDRGVEGRQSQALLGKGFQRGALQWWDAAGTRCSVGHPHQIREEISQ